jgi:aryl-alcohol dehydrogenase-like predicted oxidoreductase
VETGSPLTRPAGSERPVLGLGSQRLVDTAGCTEDGAQALFHAALDSGVRYFDTAPVYGLGQSERRLGLVAHGRRAEMWIATKTAARSRDGAFAELRESLVRLSTSWVDEWRLHHVNSIDDLDACFARGGALEALETARAEGLARHVSISGHADPGVIREALRRFPFDSVLFPASALDALHYSFVDEVLPEAAARGVASVAMKIHAHGALRHVAVDALRYALSLPVAVVLLGCTRSDQLALALDVATTSDPMGVAERAAFVSSLRPLLSPRMLPWKASEWGRDGAWIRRYEPAP